MSILMAWCNTTVVEPLVVTDHNSKIFPVEALYLESRKPLRPLLRGDDFVFFHCFYPFLSDYLTHGLVGLIGLICRAS